MCLNGFRQRHNNYFLVKCAPPPSAKSALHVNSLNEGHQHLDVNFPLSVDLGYTRGMNGIHNEIIEPELQKTECLQRYNNVKAFHS